MSKLITAALLLTALCLPGWCAAAEKVGPIVVSANRRFLQHKDGTPFFWLGDTAWMLFQKLDRAETERYLEDRRRKGFNVVQAVALHGLTDQNAYGSAALIGNDPTRPNLTPGRDPSKSGEYDYWDHVDWVVDLAASKGIYIALLPTWGSVVKSGGLNPGNVAAFARFLAERYKPKPNIFWVNGGDVRGDDHPEVWKALGQTLKQADPGHLLSYHPFGRTQSSTWFNNEPWLDFNMFQSGHRRYDQDDTPERRGEDNWRFVIDDYAKTPPRPTIDAEPSYENIPQGLHDPSQPYWTAADSRRYAYWSVFAGAFGHTYGDNAVMQMYKPGAGAGAYGVRNYWYEAINDPGSGQMQYLKRLILSQSFFERIPDPSLIAGDNGVRYDYVIATRGKAYLFAYTYTGRPFQIRMGAISGAQVRASWYSPRDGSVQPIGLLPNVGVRAFTPPGEPAPGNDWVLILVDSKLGPAQR